MKVIIDTDKKTVEVPSTTKKQLEERNKELDVILSELK